MSDSITPNPHQRRSSSLRKAYNQTNAKSDDADGKPVVSAPETLLSTKVEPLSGFSARRRLTTSKESGEEKDDDAVSDKIITVIKDTVDEAIANFEIFGGGKIVVSGYGSRWVVSNLASNDKIPVIEAIAEVVDLGYLEATETPQPYHTVPDPAPVLGTGEKLVYVTAGHIDNRLPDNYQSHFILTPGDVLYAEATLTVTDNQYHCSVLNLVVGTSSDPMFVQDGDDFTLARVRIASAHAVSGATQLTKTNKWNRTIATVGGVEQYSEGLLMQRKQVVLLIA